MTVKEIKEKFKKGTKIQLIQMNDEPQMNTGLYGTVRSVDDMGQIHMSWENGSSLALHIDEDIFVVE